MKKIFLILVFLNICLSKNLFAQNEPPQALVWVCNYNNNVYYDYLGTYSDVGIGIWPIVGVVRYYNFNPTGRRATNFGNNPSYACYRFTASSPANESCRISGNNGVRGYFLYNVIYCPLDKYVKITFIVFGIVSFNLIRKVRFA